MEQLADPADPFVAATGSRVLAADPNRAVVEQPGLAELENHVGVRHASALHAAAYEASRALVAAALEARGGGTMRLAATEIAYLAVGTGTLRSVAEPAGASWAELLAADEAELACAVATQDEAGKTVAELTAVWAVAREAS
jgi:acyl-coenzyme A thioesterase PaaI-like protein